MNTASSDPQNIPSVLQAWLLVIASRVFGIAEFLAPPSGEDAPVRLQGLAFEVGDTSWGPRAEILTHAGEARIRSWRRARKNDIHEWTRI